MGRVIVSARIENLADLYDAQKGRLPPEKVRAIEVHNALVDTGATMLSMPQRLIDQLGLRKRRTRTARTSAGVATFAVHEAVQLTVQGRDCLADVAAVPDDCPVLIGQVPLELLDFVVDPAGQKLIGNPEHGGEQMMDMF